MFTSFCVVLFIAHFNPVLSQVTSPSIASELGLKNVKDYGAVGNGIVDDTAAIQAAIDAWQEPGVHCDNWNVPSSCKPASYGRAVIYFPTGTYLISDTLRWSKHDTAQEADGLKNTRVIGDGPGKSIIKLKNNSAGFSSSANGKTVIDMLGVGSNINWAHDNYISHLTINTGRGNSGAIGLAFNSHNNGLIENVEVISEDDSGLYGITTEQGSPGPFLAKDIRVEGFDYGILHSGKGSSDYSVTFKNVTLINQRQTGFKILAYAIVHNLLSSNKNDVPVIDSQDAWHKHTILVDADLRYTGPGTANSPALFANGNGLNQGKIYARNVKVSKYATTIQSAGKMHSGHLDEFLYKNQATSVFPSPETMIDMPRKAIPACVGCQDPNNWLVFDQNAQNDDTVAFQAALNSGKPVIHLRADGNKLILSSDISIPASVKKIVFWHKLVGSGRIVNINQDTSEPVFFVYAKSFFPTIHHRSSRPVVLISNRSNYQSFAGAGDLFLEDQGGYLKFAKDQNVYAWALNPEGGSQSITAIENRGANLSIIGLKHEQKMKVLLTTDGGFSDVIGAYIYAIGKTNHPIFESIDANHSLVYRLETHAGAQYGMYVREKRNGTTKTIGSGTYDRDGLHVGYQLPNGNKCSPFEDDSWQHLAYPDVDGDGVGDSAALVEVPCFRLLPPKGYTLQSPAGNSDGNPEGSLEPSSLINGSSSYHHNQDGAEGKSTQIEVGDNGTSVVVSGNAWKKTSLPYVVTAETVLEFEVKINQLGEIHGIGFDEDNSMDNDKRMFQLAGSQLWSKAFQDHRISATNGVWVKVTIPVGQYYTGSMQYLVFANDDDKNGTASASFRNIQVSERSGLLSISELYNGLDSYESGQDSSNAVAQIVDNGQSLFISGNAWKKASGPYSITADTVLEFEVKIDKLGEIQGIGFDEDNSMKNDKRIFQLAGSQLWSKAYQDHRISATNGVWVKVTIPVGQYYTGSMQYLVFVNDDDQNKSAQSSFRNIVVSEGSGFLSISELYNGLDSYESGQDSSNADAQIVDNGQSLFISGNAWKKASGPYSIAAETVLEFEVKIDKLGEIHGIGFDEDNSMQNGKRIFQLAGSQLWSNAYQNYRISATNGAWLKVTIPVGQYYTGSMQYLVFVNDDDQNKTAQGSFRNIIIR